MTTAVTTKDDSNDPMFLGPGAQSLSETIAPLTGSEARDVTQESITLTGPEAERQEDETSKPPTQTLVWSPDQTTMPAVADEPASTPAATTFSPRSSVQVSLTYDVLSLDAAAKFISSPGAGANVFFTGTTRDTFAGRTVTRLEYTAYTALALRTMLKLCSEVHAKYALEHVYLVHRLGEVKVSEVSIVIGVSSAHRKPAWQAGEELLEWVKDRVEVWKREWFLDGTVVTAKDGQTGKEHIDTDRYTTAPGDAVPTSEQSHVAERGEWRANADNDGHGRSLAK